jgi:hypothetical protein
MQTVFLLSAINIITILAAIAMADLGDNFLMAFYALYFITFLIVLQFLSRRKHAG